MRDNAAPSGGLKSELQLPFHLLLNGTVELNKKSIMGAELLRVDTTDQPRFQSPGLAQSRFALSYPNPTVSTGSSSNHIAIGD